MRKFANIVLMTLLVAGAAGCQTTGQPTSAKNDVTCQDFLGSNWQGPWIDQNNRNRNLHGLSVLNIFPKGDGSCSASLLLTDGKDPFGDDIPTGSFSWQGEIVGGTLTVPNYPYPLRYQMKMQDGNTVLYAVANNDEIPSWAILKRVDAVTIQTGGGVLQGKGLQEFDFSFGSKQ